VLSLRRLLPVAAVRELPGVAPRTLEIRGTRMDLATRVEVNCTEMEDFGATSSSVLLVRLADGMRSRVEDVAVYTEKLDPGDASVATFDLGYHSRAADGKFRVLQNLVKRILTSPGSNIWNPSDGGGLRQVVVGNVDSRNATAVSGAVESKVMDTVGQLVRAQSLDPTLPVGERLLRASLQDILFSAADRSLNMRLVLTFQDGASLAADVGW